jgi:hypothetical protein
MEKEIKVIGDSKATLSLSDTTIYQHRVENGLYKLVPIAEFKRQEGETYIYELRND